ncbi:MAG: DUF1924 domain-containing protein [Pseudomonadota bacterium]
MRIPIVALALLCLAPPLAHADLLAGYAAQARAEDPAFKAFSAERGRQFFQARQGREAGVESCTSCHTPDPRAEGRHARTGKSILPLAPVANAERLSDPAKVEKWFKRNCNDVLARACNAREKGDFIAYLQSVR